MAKIKFCVFSDYHYNPRMYPIEQEGLDEILDRAHQNNVDCILHCGDFSAQSTTNDGFLQKFLNNKYNIPAFGCYGNHELEYVESLEALNKAYGYENSYYYKDIKGFRFVVIDTNHWQDDDGTFFHYPGHAVGSPKGWSYDHNLLGDKQIEWFEKTVKESPYPCIIVGHNPMSRSKREEHKRFIRMINLINYETPGKIPMFLTGHTHKNNIDLFCNVVHFNVNASYNGEWTVTKHNFFPKEYCEGYGMADNCCIFTHPLSAIVTVEDNGHIVIEGMETDYMYNVCPEMYGGPFPDAYGICEPRISSAEFNLMFNKGVK